MFYLRHPIQEHALNHCPFQEEGRQLPAVVQCQFDLISRAPIQQCHLHRTRGCADLVLFEKVLGYKVSERVSWGISRDFHIFLTPSLVLLASNRKPDVDLKAIEISEAILLLDCHRF